MAKSTIVTIRGIDPDLWKLFRIRCIQRNETIAQALNRILAETK